MKILLLLVIISITCITGEINNVISTPSGKLKGFSSKSNMGRDFLTFKGIPYGKAPLANLRFMPPIMAEPWEGVLDATQDPLPCIQDVEHARSPDGGTEDCLKLNILTPQINETFFQLYPIIVFFFGGKFDHGPYFNYGFDKFMDYEVVTVMPYFRVGLLGYATTLDKVMPGNYGQLDQILALKWLQKNARYFGGDASRVTMMGHSSGGMQVMLNVLSPLSKGLIHRGIAMSGCGACSTSTCVTSKQATMKVAEKLNCSLANSQTILKCLQTVSSKDIISVNDTRYFPNIENTNGYLPRPLLTLFDKSIDQKIPMMIGVLPNDAGAHLPGSFTSDTIKKYGVTGILRDFNKLLGVKNDAIERLVNNILQEYYFDLNNETKDHKQLFREFQDLFTDAAIYSCCDESIENFAEAGFPVYVYIYNHLSKIKSTWSTNREFDHGVELPLLFNFINESSFTFSSTDIQASHIMLTYWTNFAKYGNPSPDISRTGADYPVIWEQWTKEHPRHILLNENPSMADGVLSNHSKFWNDFFQCPENDSEL